MPTIEEIEHCCKVYSQANETLTEIKSQLQSEVEAVKTKYYKRVKNAIEGVVDAHTILFATIEESPEHFVKPKTVIFHGVKVGFQKGKDTLEISNPEKTVKLIEKIYDEDRAAELVKIEKVPVLDLIKTLPADEIKEIKCKLVKGSDAVVIKTVDTEVDKFIKSLTKQALEIE
jgi:hypothetical protein